jgi:hypothetical protein
LNRLGAYLSVAKTKGPPADKSVGATVEKPNEIWRRITGIYSGVKQTAKERKRGLRILARRIQERVGRARRGTAATEVATANRSSLVRALYHGSDEPFIDEWSKFEELKVEWLSRMRDMFG